MIEKLKLQGVTTAGSTPEELGAIVATELDKWGKMMRSIGIVPQ